MSIQLEILKLSYWEHFKAAKELHFIHPTTHAKIKEVEAAANEIQQQITYLIATQ